MTTPAPARTLQIPVAELTRILDAANDAWRAVVTAATPGDRIEALRHHVHHVRRYLEALDAATQ